MVQMAELPACLIDEVPDWFLDEAFNLLVYGRVDLVDLANTAERHGWSLYDLCDSHQWYEGNLIADGEDEPDALFFARIEWEVHLGYYDPDLDARPSEGDECEDEPDDYVSELEFEAERAHAEDIEWDYEEPWDHLYPISLWLRGQGRRASTSVQLHRKQHLEGIHSSEFWTYKKRRARKRDRLNARRLLAREVQGCNQPVLTF